MERNSARIRNILMVLGRIIEQVSMECKNDNSASLYFLIMSLDSYFHFISGLYLSNHLKYFNDTLKDYETGQHRLSSDNSC